MEQNKVSHLFEYANKKACELALRLKKFQKKKFLLREVYLHNLIPIKKIQEMMKL